MIKSDMDRIIWILQWKIGIRDLIELNHFFIILNWFDCMIWLSCPYFYLVNKDCQSVFTYLCQLQWCNVCHNWFENNLKLDCVKVLPRCCLWRKLWLFWGKFCPFNSSDGCNDTHAQAKENPCIVVQVVWWNNGVLDALESKAWLAWPTGKLVIIFL